MEPIWLTPRVGNEHRFVQRAHAGGKPWIGEMHEQRAPAGPFYRLIGSHGDNGEIAVSTVDAQHRCIERGVRTDDMPEGFLKDAAVADAWVLAVHTGKNTGNARNERLVGPATRQREPGCQGSRHCYSRIQVRGGQFGHCGRRAVGAELIKKQE